MQLNRLTGVEDVLEDEDDTSGSLRIDGALPDRRRSQIVNYSGFKLEHLKLPPGGHISFSFRGSGLYLSLLDIRQDAGELVIGGTPRNCQLLDLRDRMTVLPPNCDMRGWTLLKDRPNSAAILYLDPTSLGVELGLEKLPHIQPLVRFEDSGLRQTLTKLHALPPPSCHLDAALVESLALVALVEVYRLTEPRPTLDIYDRGQLTAYQQRIIRDALADPAADLSLTGLASLVQLSRYHFARLFKKTYGLPPHQYVVHQRVEAAKAMLADIDVDPRRLGHSLGFANYGSFSKAFKQVTGVTPYRFQRVQTGRRREDAAG